MNNKEARKTLIPLKEFAKEEIMLGVTPNQKHMIEQIRENTVTIVHGPAGTGKTFIAIAEGIRTYLSQKKRKNGQKEKDEGHLCATCCSIS